MHWWSWRYLPRNVIAVQLPVLHVRRKAGQVRHCRWSQRARDACVWAIEFCLAPPKCRRSHCSNHPQRRLWTVFSWFLTVRSDSAPRQTLQTAVDYAWLLAQGSLGFLAKCLPPSWDFPTTPHTPSQCAGDNVYLPMLWRAVPTSQEDASQCHAERGALMQNGSSRNRILVPSEPSPVPTGTAWMSFLPPGGAGRELLGMGQLTTPCRDCTIPADNRKEYFLFSCFFFFPSPSPGNSCLSY